MSLSPYAKSHIRLLCIKNRYNDVLGRMIDKIELGRCCSSTSLFQFMNLKFAIKKGNDAGSKAIELALEDQEEFDREVHGVTRNAD